MENCYKYKQVKSIGERVTQFKLFYSKENDRLGFFLGSEYPVHRYPAAKSITEEIELTPMHFNVEAHLNDY